MGRKKAVEKYSVLLDPEGELPDWAKRYARWLVRQNVWNEKVTGQGRRKKSRAEHLDEIERVSGVRLPWKVVICLRGLPKFREYGDRWGGNREMRVAELRGEVREKSLLAVSDRLDRAEAMKVSELGRLVVAGEALQARVTEGERSSPLIQINITESQARAVQKALEAPAEEIQDVSWEIVKE